MIKGVPPLAPTPRIGSPRKVQKTQKTMQKKESENGGTEPENQGAEPHPLAPAQSKRTFAFSRKTQKIIGNASISAPFFGFFLHLFRDFSGKAEKGIQGPAPGP